MVIFYRVSPVEGEKNQAAEATKKRAMLNESQTVGGMGGVGGGDSKTKEVPIRSGEAEKRLQSFAAFCPLRFSVSVTLSFPLLSPVSSLESPLSSRSPQQA